MWDWFINGLVWVIETFAGWFGDYGLAIIAMTIVFRLLLMPLTMKQLKSSARMQVLQPKLTEIQERYADDPVRMQEEMRRFQAENNFNPLGGCLPMLLQWPIFFALFGALRTISAAHPDASFLGIMPSISMSANEAFAAWGLGGALVYIIMDVAFGVLTFVPMLLSTQMQWGACLHNHGRCLWCAYLCAYAFKHADAVTRPSKAITNYGRRYGCHDDLDGLERCWRRFAVLRHVCALGSSPAAVGNQACNGEIQGFGRASGV